MKKTKILCTIGPASIDEKTLQMMQKAGMSGARINTAYGDMSRHNEMIAKIRRIGETPIFLDLKGPELRIRVARPLRLSAGDTIRLGEGMELSFNHPVYDQFGTGDKVLFNDARVQTEVASAKRASLKLLVRVGGLLEDGNGVNCPGKRLDIPTLGQRDLDLLSFAKEQEVEFVALSFVRDVQDVRNLSKEIGNDEISIIAKIENGQGVGDFDRILSEVDGIMVARGDLGIEVEQEIVPLLQKRMITACNQAGKMVVTATEMLESMLLNPRPTRAEVSDVANAILDGTDAVMLSGETAIGKYPVEAVDMMARIAEATEEAVVCKVEEETYQNISSVISRSVFEIARSMPLNKVVTITRTGYTPRAIARFKLKQPVIAVTGSQLVRRKLEMVYGVYPFYFEYGESEDRILSVGQMLLSKGVVNQDDIVLFTAGFRTSQRHSSNLIEIHTIRELMEFRIGHGTRDEVQV